MSKLSSTTLGELIEFQRGYDLPKSKFIAGNIPVVSSNGVLGYHNEFKVKAPGITIGRSGTVGLPHYIESDFFPHNTSLFIKEFNKNNPKYIFYLLKNLGLNNHKSGSGVPTMNRNHLHPLKVMAVLDKEEQQKIANILSTLDAKIELNNRINVELEAMAKTLYDYWFVQFDFPNAKGEPYKSSGGKMVYNEELKREIPEGWEVKTLENIENNIITGKTPPKKETGFFNGDIPFITIGDIRENMHIVSTEETLTKNGADYQRTKYLNKGAICVSCIASPGLVGFVTELSQANQQINSIECEKEENKYYLYFALIDFFITSKAKTGNTFPNMNKGDFSSIEFIYPNEDVLNKFKKLVKPIFDNVLNNLEQTQTLKAQRDFLLPMLMNGQVSVK